MKTKRNIMASLALISGLLLAPTVFAQTDPGIYTITFTIVNNTSYNIVAQPEGSSPGSCAFNPNVYPNQIQCDTDNFRIFQSVQFSLDGGLTFHNSAPVLFVGIEKKGDSGTIEIQNAISTKYCIEASVTPSTWDGQEDNPNGVITFDYSPFCASAPK